MLMLFTFIWTEMRVKAIFLFFFFKLCCLVLLGMDELSSHTVYTVTMERMERTHRARCISLLTCANCVKPIGCPDG